MKPEILARWDKLSCDDLKACDYQYDLVVEAVRKAYFTGRSHLSLEGELRDWLNERIRFYEDQKDIH